MPRASGPTRSWRACTGRWPRRPDRGRRQVAVVIDAHQHFWAYGTYQTSWMERPPYAGDAAFAPLRRSFAPADLLPELEAAGVQATIAIEAADGEAENAALLANARAHPWI